MLYFRIFLVFSVVAALLVTAGFLLYFRIID